MTRDQFSLAPPDLQVRFALSLEKIRRAYLQEALMETVSRLDLARLNRELSEFVPEPALRQIAGRGLRGELLFPVPYLLQENPALLAYYRLLLGYSQKAFFLTSGGLSRFKSMEEKGLLAPSLVNLLPALCRALVAASCHLLQGLGRDRITAQLLDDLTLITLGPQLRGGANVRIGAEAIERVMAVIEKIVAADVRRRETNRLVICNAAQREVSIEIAPDPDIIIREEMADHDYRNIIAIEIKGGTDFPNVHNRIREAEKSHQKARQKGFVECWTIVNVDKLDHALAQRESPSTNRFYRLADLENPAQPESRDFSQRIVSLIGIETGKKRRRPNKK